MNLGYYWVEVRETWHSLGNPLCIVLFWENRSTAWCHFNTVNFLQNPHKSFPKAHLQGQVMEYLLWVPTDLYSDPVTAVWYAIFCYVGLRYNSTNCTFSFIISFFELNTEALMKWLLFCRQIWTTFTFRLNSLWRKSLNFSQNFISIPIANKSALDQIMACTKQVISLYLSKCRWRYMMTYSIISPQRVKASSRKIWTDLVQSVLWLLMT